MDRRNFLAGSAGLAASALGSPNDTIRIAVIGLRGRGNSHIKAWAASPRVEIAALCDIDESILSKRVREVEALTHKKPEAHFDIRKLLEDKSIDAVSIASPNQWHTLMAIWACQAGKDVYVEKPCSYNIFECRQIVAAARKYDRLVQHGTQTRSSPAARQVTQQIREGVLGDMYLARGQGYKWRDTIGRAAEEPVPAGVHYDLWVGPAPMRPFTRNRFHYNWHWNWDYGNGEIGNIGIHALDHLRWTMGVKYPTRVVSMGEKVMFDDDQQTPNIQTALYEFNEGGKKQMISYETRHWITDGGEGAHFYGSKGYTDGSHFYLGKDKKPAGEFERANSEAAHFANFIQALRSRKRSDLHAEIEEGATSCVLVHLANISHRLQRPVRFDAATMSCIGDDEANRMLTRKYRAPYIVPEKV
jgi:predicted dehydrogenase